MKNKDKDIKFYMLVSLAIIVPVFISILYIILLSKWIKPTSYGFLFFNYSCIIVTYKEVIYIKILLNLIAGLFFLVGVIISLKNKNNKSLINISIASAFVVLIYLLVFDILPECSELLTGDKRYLILAGIFIGFTCIFLLEKLIPNHSHYENIDHHEKHLTHIGTITSLALILHNMVEGMSIYAITSSDLKSGLLCLFGVGMHNIPFGIEITTLLEKENKTKKWIYLILLIFSTFIGGLIILLFERYMTDDVLGVLLSISVGMILYLLIFELFTELKENFNKSSIIGLLIGLIIMIIGLII